MHNVTSLYANPHKEDACVFSCNLPLEFVWQNDRDLLRATVLGWNGYRNESPKKVGLGEENSPTAPAGNRTCDLSITSPAL